MSNAFTWVPTNAMSSRHLEHKAVCVGKEGHDGSPIYVGRCKYGSETMPCKVIPKHNVAFVSYNGKEISINNFELYCMSGPRLEWVACKDGNVPAGAVAAGTASSGELLYIGRANYGGATTPGKVHPSHHCLYIPFSGKEVSIKTYEVMVHKYY